MVAVVIASSHPPSGGEGFATLAATHGWTYVERDDSCWWTGSTGHPSGWGTTATPAICLGDFDGRGFVAFDYDYTTSTSNGNGQDHQRHHSAWWPSTGAAFPPLR